MVAGGIKIRCIVRSLGNLHHLPRGIDLIPVADISRLNNWNIILSGIDTVVHLAAKAHRFKKEHLSDFYRINVRLLKLLLGLPQRLG
jgi:nucleoside-diphosphate-sugar epimerase